MNQENPLFRLLEEHGPLPFSSVSTDHYEQALDEAIAVATKNVEAIVGNPEPATFKNTVTALEASDEGMDRISSVFYHLLHVETNEAMQALAETLPPKLSAYHNDVMMNAGLYNRLKAVEATKGTLDLEERQVLDDLVAAFRRNGADLNPEEQQQLRELDRQLSTAAPKFAEHVLKATQAFSLWVNDPACLEDMPDSAKRTAKALAEKEGREEEWKFTLDAPSFVPFMTYCPDAGLREQMWRAYTSRCVEGEFENQYLIKDLLTWKYERARLLGYQHHADFTLERRMVGSEETLRDFYGRMTPTVMKAAVSDIEDIRACKEAKTGEPELFPWDLSYFTELLRQQKFELKQEEFRPWFSLDTTLGMAFDLAGKLFHLRFDRDESYQGYRDSLWFYHVVDDRDETEIGTLLIDPFPRASKRPGAWMNALLGQGQWSGQVRRPFVGIVMNLTPPTETSPSLLTLDEARTVFHEMGHALHELLSQCTHRSVAGTHVRWDFVELPSQLMENWLLEPEFLRAYPRHVETGEPLPEELIAKLQLSKTFQKGYAAARQISFGVLDLAWHTTPPDAIGEDLIAFEREATQDLRLFPPQEGSAMSPSFQHIFSGGYSAGYYSYKWAEVLEADVFEVFLEKGLFDEETADSLVKEILSKGGSLPPDELFRNFRGRDPDPDALLKRDGLIARG